MRWLRRERQRLPTAGIIAVMTLVLAAVVVFSIRLHSSVEELRIAAMQSAALVDATDRVLDVLQDAEAGERGFLLTMRAAYLEPFTSASERLDGTLVDLARLSSGSAVLAPHVAALRHAAEIRFDELSRSVQTARSQGQDAAIRLNLTSAGKASMDEARRQASVLVSAAKQDGELHWAALAQRERTAIYGLGSAAGVGALLLGVSTLWLLHGRQRLHRVQGALRAESDRLQGTINKIRDSVAVFDGAGALVIWNRTFFRRTGLPEDLARVGTPFADFARSAADWQPPLLSEPHPQGAPRVAELRQGNRVLEVWRSPMPDGGQMVAVADITRRVEAEARASQAQRLQALGQLTGGVAHDFNNLLQVISVNLELLEGRLIPDPWLNTRLAAAKSGVERGARLIRHLLAFARRQPLAPKTVAVGDLLRGMEDMLHRTLGSGVTVTFDIQPTLWSVRVDPQQLENAVLNLAINARDAMPDGGFVRLDARNLVLREADGQMPELLPGDYVAIGVADTGIGMSAEQIARAVEPFYTTKPEGRGTGLGLSMVYGFARQSGGFLRLSSTPGVGTRACIYIPRMAAATGPPLSEAAAESTMADEDARGLAAQAP